MSILATQMREMAKSNRYNNTHTVCTSAEKNDRKKEESMPYVSPDDEKSTGKKTVLSLNLELRREGKGKCVNLTGDWQKEWLILRVGMLWCFGGKGGMCVSIA